MSAARLPVPGLALSALLAAAAFLAVPSRATAPGYHIVAYLNLPADGAVGWNNYHDVIVYAPSAPTTSCLCVAVPHDGLSVGTHYLGPLSDGPVIPKAVNDHGVVVGAAFLSDGHRTHAFRWTVQAGTEDLTPGSPVTTSANAVKIGR